MPMNNLGVNYGYTTDSPFTLLQNSGAFQFYPWAAKVFTFCKAYFNLHGFFVQLNPIEPCLDWKVAFLRVCLPEIPILFKMVLV